MKRKFLDKVAHPKHELFIPIEKFFASKKKYILVAIGILIFLILFKNIIFLLAIGMIVMFWDYILHSTHFPLHMDFLFFAGIIVARIYGIETAIFFALITGNLPEIITGSFDVSDMLSTLPVILLCFVSVHFTTYSIVFTGIIYSVIFAAIEFLTALILAEPPMKVIFEPLAVLVMNIILFTNLASPIISIFG